VSGATFTSWSRICAGKNKDGSPCGNKVPTRASGVYVRGPYCHVHKRRAVPAPPCDVQDAGEQWRNPE
jgi:hypothetical protein